MEVSHDFVDPDSAFDAASFPALGIEVFGVVFTLALFYALATAEGPGDGGVSFADFVAGVAASGFDACSGGRGAVTFAAVGGVEMLGIVFVSMIILR